MNRSQECMYACVWLSAINSCTTWPCYTYKITFACRFSNLTSAYWKVGNLRIFKYFRILYLSG